MPHEKSMDWKPSAGVSVLAGPARSGKTSLLVRHYRQALASGAPGTNLWFAPTRRAAESVRRQLLDGELPGCFRPGVLTFRQFADLVLLHASQPMRPLDAWAKRRLIEQLIAEAAAEQRLKYFLPVAHRAGLVDMCVQFISELKRLEIWPDEFRVACQRRGMSDKDRELLNLYEAYQLKLNEHQLYDAEGCFWSARALLKEGQREPFPRLEHVFVDGFSDFTRTEEEVLALLADRSQSLVVSLPLEPGNDRRELFAKPHKTLVRLQRLGARVHWLGRPEPKSWPAMAHLERELFKNPRKATTTSDNAGVTLCVAARALGEIERIAREIKSLLQGEATGAGAPPRPDEVAVVFRSLSDIAPLVREVFDEFGLPVSIEAAEPLGQSRLLAALVNVLAMVQEDWPFRRLLALVTSAYFQPKWPAWRAGQAAVPTELAIRDLQLSSGRAALVAELQWESQRELPSADAELDEDEQHRQARRARQRQRASTAAAVLARLDSVLARLPERAPASDWGKSLAELAEELGFLHALESGDRAARRDRAAWLRLSELLEGADRLWSDLGCPRPELDCGQFLEQLLNLLRLELFPRAAEDAGRIRVLEAPSARGIEIPYLFFAGLSERAFPPPAREDRFYTEAEYKQLSDGGLPLVLRTERNQEEMLLFYEVLTRATRRLHLSYPGIDAKAQPLLPSPYLAEVVALLDLAAPAELPELSPIPTGDPKSTSDLRLLAIVRGLDGDGGLLAGLFQAAGSQSLGENLSAALTSLASRGHRDAYGPWEGLLASEPAAELLARRYDAERRWSPSELESYAYCPFRFALEKVLRLEPLPDLELEIDYRTRGSRLHAILAELHRRLEKSANGTSLASLDEASYGRLAGEIVAEWFERDESRPLERAMAEIDRRLIVGWLEAYYKQHAAYEATKGGPAPQPAHFEVSFGLTRSTRSKSDPLSTEKPLVLSAGGEAVLIAGRIDRIDVAVAGKQPLFNVLDYKTGGARTKKEVEQGEALQLALYALAVQDLLLADAHAVPYQVGYWMINGKGYTKMLDLYAEDAGRWKATDQWQHLREQLLERVLALVHGVRQGDFPVACRDTQCAGRCDYRTVCRVNQVRSLEKEWPSPPPNSR